MRILASALQYWRLSRLRWSGAQIGSARLLGAGIACRRGIHDQRQGVIRFKDDCEVDVGVVLYAYGGEIDIGAHVFVGPHCVLYGHGGIHIGDHTLLAMQCRILSSEHTIPPPGTLIRSQPDVRLPTRIGRDVWLGANVTVLGGVTIGDGSVIGAGAVVTRDVPPNSVAVGAPARVIRSR